jgi:glycosyltransferase involved in cell wall biosynthesis
MLSVRKTKSFLFIIGFTCPFPGAGWWRIFSFARHFKDKGYECYVLSSFSPTTLNFPNVERKENIYIYNIIPSIVGLKNPFFLLNNILASIISLPFLLFIRPTAVIISVPPANQLLSVFILSKIMRFKLAIDYRDEFEDCLIMHTTKWAFFYRFLKRLLTSLYRNAALVTPVTPAVAENLNRRGIYNVKVVYDGVDTTIFQPFNKNKMRSEFHIPQDSFVIAYLGNVYEPYRVDVVIRALKKLNEKDPKRRHLLILAGGGDVKSVLNLASDFGISDSVKYFGVIKNPIEIAKILSSADCGMIPYDDNPLWQKTYSTKLFEYSAVGLPVIATVHENSALATVIKVNNMGLIIPPINSDALASSLETLSADKESRIKMSVSALQFARMHDKEELAGNLLGTIEALP